MLGNVSWGSRGKSRWGRREEKGRAEGREAGVLIMEAGCRQAGRQTSRYLR
jgi:hypothetical protein